MISVVLWQFRSWVQILLSFKSFFFFEIEETCPFVNDLQLEISSKCDIEAGTVLPCVKIPRGERAFQRMLTSVDPNVFPERPPTMPRFGGTYLRYRRIQIITAPIIFGFSRPKGPLLSDG